MTIRRLTPVHLALMVTVVLLVLVGRAPVDMGRTLALSGATNPIVAENLLTGSDAWVLGQNGHRVSDDLTQQVKGYASSPSVDLGGSVDVKVSVNPAQSYSAQIFRLGYYAGKGARLMDTLPGRAGTRQPACTPATDTGLIECGWSTGFRIDVPTGWTSGIYLIVLTNAAGYQSYVQFVVRDDARHSELLFKQSVLTYQAYNNYPNDGLADCKGTPATGKNLYDSQSSPAKTVTGTSRAVKVSFDRPYPCSGGGSLLDPDWSWEGYFLTWLEMKGYDVSYTTDVDVHLRPQTLLDHKGVLSVGHDEYWTKEMFDAMESARDHGVNVGFFGGNDAYWQARLEPSSTGVPARTMVVYKNTPNNTYTTVDPVADPTLRTVRFQDPPVNRAAQSLIGTSFLGSTDRSTLNADLVVAADGGWPWGAAGVAGGTSVPGVVGYETDGYSCHCPPPANQGLALLAASPFQGSDKVTGTSHAVAYVAPSGALVFSSGTMSWVWGLVAKIDPRDPTRQATLYNPGLERATVVVVDALAGRTSPPSLPSFTPDCTADISMGFEGPAVTGADGAMRSFGSVALDTQSPVAGAASAHVSGASSYLDQPMTAVDTVTLDFSLRLDELPAYPTRVAVISSQITDLGNLVLNPVTGGVSLRLRNGSPPIGSASQLLERGRTYQVRLVQNRGTGTNAVLAAWVAPEGTELGAPFAQTSTATFTGKADKVRVGSTTNSQTTPPVLDADIDTVGIVGGPAAPGMSLPPSAPTGLTASMSGTMVQLQWTDTATTEATYEVQRSTDDGATWSSLVTLPPDSTTYQDSTALSSNRYAYRVLALNSNGPSAPSPVASITTPAAPPAPPSSLVATGVSQTRTDLTWVDQADNETGFELQRAPGSDFAGAVTWSLPADTTTFSDTTGEGVAWYRVRSLGGSPSAWTPAVNGPRQADLTFEGGSLSGAQGATAVVGPVSLETAAPLVGTASARFRPATTTSYLEQRLPAAAPETYLTLTLRINALGTGDARIVQSLNGTGGTAPTTGSFWVKADGTLLLRNYNTTIGTGTKLLPGVTYRLGLHQRRVTDSSILLEGFVAAAGQPFGTAFAKTVSAPVTTSTDITTVRAGVMASTNTLDATVDEIHIDRQLMPSR
ncbi:fibronectin type III domain-containing protein [Terrabacter tumescens]|nr:fibronectin type III domain-containing protein [Terrabacter tumescens]